MFIVVFWLFLEHHFFETVILTACSFSCVALLYSRLAMGFWLRIAAGFFYLQLKICGLLLNIVLNVQACDATVDAQRMKARFKKLYYGFKVLPHRMPIFRSVKVV